MSFLHRLFGYTKDKAPNEKALSRQMTQAREENQRAVRSFVKTSQKQERDALFARHVIEQVLERADKLKDNKNVGLQK